MGSCLAFEAPVQLGSAVLPLNTAYSTAPYFLLMTFLGGCRPKVHARNRALRVAKRFHFDSPNRFESHGAPTACGRFSHLVLAVEALSSNDSEF